MAEVDRARGRVGAVVLQAAIVVATALVVALVVQHWVANSYWIPSASMEPQLQVHDRVVVSKLAYDLHAPRRGDIVVFAPPPGPWRQATLGTSEAVGPSSHLIKRVIGLPGERVMGREGHVYIDGRVLTEPYLPPGTMTSSFGPLVVPKTDVWVMGDNRANSEDSRAFGPIPQSTIVGRALWRVWPLSHLSFL